MATNQNGNVVVEKTVEIGSDKKISAFDNLITPVTNEVVDVEEPEVVVDDKDKVVPIKKAPEKVEEDKGTTEGGEADKGQPSQQPDEDKPIPLDELYVDVDGSERTVVDLLNERTELSKRIAEIEKDPFLKGFIDHYLVTGNANEYLDAKGVDWDKKDDVEILRNKFERENSDLDPKIREKLWKRELADKYKIKPDLSQEEKESEDYEIAQGLLKRDADKIRKQFKEDQNKFQIVDRKKEDQKPQKFDNAAYKTELLKDKVVDNIVKNKILKLAVKNESGQSFGFEPENTEHVIEMMADDSKFWGSFIKDGKVDRELHAKVCAYLQNPDEFEKQLVDFGKTLSLEDRLKEVKNTDNRLNKKTLDSQTKETTFSKGLLTAALKQKK
jgi:hypothetical protein